MTPLKIKPLPWLTAQRGGKPSPPRYGEGKKLSAAQLGGEVSPQNKFTQRRQGAERLKNQASFKKFNFFEKLNF